MSGGPYEPKGRKNLFILDLNCQHLRRVLFVLCPVWWMSYFTHSVVDVRCGGCLVWWMSGVVDVWCGGCPILLIVWWMSGVVVVWCGGCPISPMVWWMSGVVDVCVVDVD